MSASARLISLPLPLLSNAILSAARVPAECRWPCTCALFPRPQSKMFATRASTSVIARSRSLQSARARAMAQIELFEAQLGNCFLSPDHPPHRHPPALCNRQPSAASCVDATRHPSAKAQSSKSVDAEQLHLLFSVS